LDLVVISALHKIEHFLNLDVLELVWRLKNLDIVIVLNKSKVLPGVLHWVLAVLKKLLDLSNGLFGEDVGSKSHPILVVSEAKHYQVVGLVLDEAF